MAIVRGRNTRVEISKTLSATPIAVSAMTLANPAVATATAAHTLALGAVGYFRSVTGMEQLEGQAASVTASATPAFTLGKLNTTKYTALTAAEFMLVTAWSLFSTATQYEIPNAESDKLDGTCLIHNIKQELTGMLAAQSVTVSGFSDPSLEAIDLINAAAIDGEGVIVRITLEDGSRRLFRGVPSLPGESLGVNALGTNSLSFATTGRVLFLPKVA